MSHHISGGTDLQVPSFGRRLMSFAGSTVAIATTSSSGKPSPRNLLMTPREIGYARGIAGKDVDVGGDRVGRAALRDDGLGHGVIKAAAAVADIEDDATLLGRQRRRQLPPSCTMFVKSPARSGFAHPKALTSGQLRLK
jgi:hypothetical protein